MSGPYPLSSGTNFVQNSGLGVYSFSNAFKVALFQGSMVVTISCKSVYTGAIRTIHHHDLAWLAAAFHEPHVKILSRPMEIEARTLFYFSGLILLSAYFTATTLAFTEVNTFLNEISYVLSFFLSRMTCGDVASLEIGRLRDFVPWLAASCLLFF